MIPARTQPREEFAERPAPQVRSPADGGGQLADTKPAFWREGIARYERADRGRALLDLATSVVPYIALSVVMYLTLRSSHVLALALAVPTAVFLVRTFIVFHDCSHGSFLGSKRANTWLGIALGLLLFSPFARWRSTRLRKESVWRQSQAWSI